jgi:hypothetical protein
MTRVSGRSVFALVALLPLADGAVSTEPHPFSAALSGSLKRRGLGSVDPKSGPGKGAAQLHEPREQEPGPTTRSVPLPEPRELEPGPTTRSVPRPEPRAVAEPRPGPKDDNPLCPSWAVDGECIRNPQYMWAACRVACEIQNYMDLDSDCMGWAQAGECEKNPDFMLQVESRPRVTLHLGEVSIGRRALLADLQRLLRRRGAEPEAA